MKYRAFRTVLYNLSYQNKIRIIHSHNSSQKFVESGIINVKESIIGIDQTGGGGFENWVGFQVLIQG